jgi:quercetin dioxygenase-like cupin family protein
MAHEVVSPVFERKDERGVFQEILNTGTWESLICGHMNAGAVIGNHYHKKSVIFFYLTRGAVRIRTVHAETGARDDFVLKEGQGVILHPYESHAIRFLEESELIMLKSRRYLEADPDTFHFPVED